MNGELPKYVNVPLDDWPGDLLLDLCYCYDCVQEYHRLQEELIVKVEKHKKVCVLLSTCNEDTVTCTSTTRKQLTELCFW